MNGLPERGGLADQQAETRMNDLEGEAERAAADVGVGHGQSARRQPCRQGQPAPESARK